MTTEWGKALPWLCERGHMPSAADEADLRRYFQKHPEQVKVKDRAGSLPLHAVAWNQTGEHATAIVNFLLIMWPDAAQQTNAYGDLPLHDAAWKQSGEHGGATMMRILTAYPRGTQVKDASGMLPIDYAQQHNPNLTEMFKATLHELTMTEGFAAQLAAKDALIAAKDTQMVAKDAQLAAKEAQLVAVNVLVEAMEAAQLAWLKPGFSWRAGDIYLSPALDEGLTYLPRRNIVCADPRAVGAGHEAGRLAYAIEQLVARGGSRGDPFKASVDAITLCKNQSLITSFNERLARLYLQTQVGQTSGRFDVNWGDPAGTTAATLQDRKKVFARLIDRFVKTDVESWPGVKVTLMWHGVPSSATADDICCTGLSARVSGNDEGFFGKGVYLTPEAEYAAFYANGQKTPDPGETYTLLLCAVCVANPYPLTKGWDYDGFNGNISKFHYNYGAPGTAKALYKGFDAHFVAINTKERWQAATNVADADFHEMVVASEEQVLPFAQIMVTPN